MPRIANEKPAAIDGASKWQQIWRITIPQLIPMMVLLTILNIGGIFRSNFDLFYTLPNGAGVLRPVTLTIVRTATVPPGTVFE